MESRHWLVIYVKSCMEKRTAERLRQMGVECYLPVQRRWHRWSDRNKQVDHLVLPLMLFVHVSPAERSLPLTLQAVSRYMVLRGESTPAIIPDEQMDRFRFLIDHSEQEVELNPAPLAAGDPVRVISGPLDGLEGEFIRVRNQDKIAIRIDQLGCVCVDISPDMIEKR